MSEDPPYAQNMPKPFLSESNKKDTAKITQIIGEHLIESHRFFARGERSPIWTYNEKKGIWEEIGKEFIQHFAKDHLKKYGIYSTHRVNEIVSYIRFDSYDTSIRLGEETLNKVVMKNGMFDLEAYTFEPKFSPEEYHVKAIPVSYNPKAKCPNITKFLKEVLIPRNAEGKYPKTYDNKAIKAVLEFFGFCLMSGHPFQFLLMIVGGGENGKTLLLLLFKGFLGKENTSASSLQQLNEDKNARANLFGKSANLCGDIPSTPLKDFGMIKILTGGDDITVDKKYQDLFTFINGAKLIFSANLAPPILEDSRAVWRRLRIINTPNIFTPGNDYYIPKEKLLSMLMTEEELSGLFNLAIEGVKRLRSSGKLTGMESFVQTKEDYTRVSDPIHYMVMRDWLRREVLALPVRCSVVYDYYVMVAGILGRRTVSNTLFGKYLRKYVPVESKQLTVEREKVWHYINMEVDHEALGEWLRENTVKNVENVEKPIVSSKGSIVSNNKEEPRSPRSVSSNKPLTKTFEKEATDEIFAESELIEYEGGGSD